MSKPDKNLISFSGDETGTIWRNGEWLFGPNFNGEMRRHVEAGHQATFDPAQIADTIKLSGVRNFELTLLGEVVGGYEDCVDINNRCSNVTIYARDGFCGTGRYVLTIKGGSQDIYVSGPVLAPGRECDACLGNWSDQSREPTTNVGLDLSRDGRPVRWRNLNATPPAFTRRSGPYRRLLSVPGFLRPAFVWAYGLGKRLGLPI
jgi:hypothetical protein